MKNPLSITALILVLNFFAASVFAQETPQKIVLPISKPNEPIFLEIDIRSADIEVIGEERDDAEFEILVAGSERKIITPSGTRTLSNSGYELEIIEDDNYIELDTDVRNSKVTVLARVPRRANLELETVHNGTIIVRNIEGKLQLENGTGPISVTNISGSVIAEARNSAVNVSFSKLDSNDISSLRSINGDIVIGLADNIGAEFHLDNSRGEIISDFEVDVQPSRPIVERDDRDDGVSVRVENTIVATVNGGGPIIKLKTLNGNIQINKVNE